MDAFAGRGLSTAPQTLVPQRRVDFVQHSHVRPSEVAPTRLKLQENENLAAARKTPQGGVKGVLVAAEEVSEKVGTWWRIRPRWERFRSTFKLNPRYMKQHLCFFATLLSLEEKLIRIDCFLYARCMLGGFFHRENEIGKLTYMLALSPLLLCLKFARSEKALLDRFQEIRSKQRHCQRKSSR